MSALDKSYNTYKSKHIGYYPVQRFDICYENLCENELIEKGQKIGEVGSTGRVTGPHLHWTVYLNKVRINPESIIQENFLESLL